MAIRRCSPRRCRHGRANRGACGDSRRQCTTCTSRPPTHRRIALDERTHPAWTRLKFDELIAQQLSLKMHRRARARRKAPRLAGDGSLTRTLLARLPFTLTRAQQRVIARDPPRSCARRADAAPAAGRRRQRQDHRRRAGGAAGDRIGLSGRVHGADGNPGRAALPQALGVARRTCRFHIAWLSGWVAGEGTQKRAGGGAQRRRRISRSARTRCSRTRSALPKLGLAIVDEQHRFGVAQRLALRQKGIGDAHQLMMSATPIPRTLAMSFYADLDVSVIDEMPPGRTPVATKLVSQRRRARSSSACASSLSAADRSTGCVR